MECVDIINTLAPCLVAAGWNPNLANLLSLLLGVVIMATLTLLTVFLLIWAERKFAARVQDRIGPNRVGPYGSLQTFADAIKLITKEDITPSGADKVLHNIAPILSVISVLLIWAVIPFSPIHIGVDLEIGVLYFITVASIGTLAIVLAGWSSNNKYALLGAFRAIALIVSYEVPMILALLVPVMLAGSMSMQDITYAQSGMWYIVLSPLAAIIFFIANLAETGRSPFDLLEAESELIAGYKFLIFMAGEFLHVFTVSVLTAVLFLGGWWGPGVEQIPALGFIYLGLKSAVVYLFMLLIRNTLPRFRIDQVMSINWKFMVPLSIVLVLVQSFLLKLVDALGLAPAPELAGDLVANIPQTIVLLLGNIVLGLTVMNMLHNRGRKLREAEHCGDRQRLTELSTYPPISADRV